MIFNMKPLINQVKANNKMKLAQYLQQTTGVNINPASMFDIQVSFKQNALASEQGPGLNPWILTTKFILKNNKMI